MIKYREISGLIFLKNLIKELKQLLKIGIPIYGSQISYMGMGVTDTIVAGRASALDLSGLAIGNALSMPFYFLLGGCLFAVTPIVAQLFGAKKYEEIGQMCGDGCGCGEKKSEDGGEEVFRNPWWANAEKNKGEGLETEPICHFHP